MRPPAAIVHRPGSPRRAIVATAMADGISDVTTVAGVGRAWLRAIRRPWVAAASAVATGFVVIQLLRVLTTPLEHTSALVSLSLVLGMPALIATLPKTTLRWRIASLLVGLQVGPILNSPVESFSVSAYVDTLEAAFAADGRGLLLILVCSLISLPLLEATGAWLRRHELAREAARRMR
jgi:hypothetical protein